MKHKNEKIIKLAHEVAELEKDISLGKDVQENEKKIQMIMSSLSIKELFTFITVMDDIMK